MNQVTIIESPVTDRYVRPGMTGTISVDGKQIRVGDAWFDFDRRWIVEPTQPSNNIQNVKTGKVYEFIGYAEDATNGMADVNGRYAVYRDGENLYVRKKGEFLEKFKSYTKP